MRLESPVINNSNHKISKRFSCQGMDINPPLVIEDIPKEAKTLALIMDDPDTPAGNWVHWIVFNIPVMNKIEENSNPGKPGVNDFGLRYYSGPCPDRNFHRFSFRVYALDAELQLKEGIGKKTLEKAMEGHVLGEAELVGVYTREAA